MSFIYKKQDMRVLHGEKLVDVVKRLLPKIRARDGNPKLPFFLPELGNLAWGFETGITEIGARTSHGKSAFMLKCASHLAKLGKNVSFVTLEDRNESATERVISRALQINNRLMKKGDLAGFSDEQILTALSLENFSLFDCYGFNMRELAEIYEHHIFDNNHKADIIFLDYLGRVDEFSGYESISDFMKHLDAWSQFNEIPIVIGVQINRSGVNDVSNDKVKGSGAIEEVAQKMVLLNHPWQLGISDAFKPTKDHENEIRELDNEYTMSGKPLSTLELLNKIYFEVSITKGKGDPVGHKIACQFWGKYYDFKSWKCPYAMMKGFCVNHGYEPE